MTEATGICLPTMYMLYRYKGWKYKRSAYNLLYRNTICGLDAHLRSMPCSSCQMESPLKNRANRLLFRGLILLMGSMGAFPALDYFQQRDSTKVSNPKILIPSHDRHNNYYKLHEIKCSYVYTLYYLKIWSTYL